MPNSSLLSGTTIFTNACVRANQQQKNQTSNAEPGNLFSERHIGVAQRADEYKSSIVCVNLDARSGESRDGVLRITSHPTHDVRKVSHIAQQRATDQTETDKFFFKYHNQKKKKTNRRPSENRVW